MRINISAQCQKSAAPAVIRRPVKNDQIHQQIVRFEKFRNSFRCRVESDLRRIAEYTGIDQSEGDSLTALFCGKRKAVSVAGGKLFDFVSAAAVPAWRSGQNDVFAGQIVRCDAFCLADGAAAERFAGAFKCSTRSAADRTEHTAAAAETGICADHNGIARELCQIGTQEMEGHGSHPFCKTMS